MNVHPSLLRKISAIGALTLIVSGCARHGDIDETGGVTVVRSACPAAAVPAFTGDMTLFNGQGRTDAGAVDAVATLTNLRSTCTESGDQFYTEATFDVQARRTDTSVARDLVVPYFSVVVRGGNAVIAKRVGQVRLSFAAGQDRASASAKAASYVDRASATLPAEIERQIKQKRKAGDEDAAIDPLADPKVRSALQRTSFELLVGFNLTPEQLRYNATR